eukprot:7448374-Pyramimonas_sp.AAC.4
MGHVNIGHIVHEGLTCHYSNYHYSQCYALCVNIVTLAMKIIVKQFGSRPDRRTKVLAEAAARGVGKKPTRHNQRKPDQKVRITYALQIAVVKLNGSIPSSVQIDILPDAAWIHTVPRWRH